MKLSDVKSNIDEYFDKVDPHQLYINSCEFYRVKDTVSSLVKTPKCYKRWLEKAGINIVSSSKSKHETYHSKDDIHRYIVTATGDEICVLPSNDSSDDYFICVPMPKYEHEFLELIEELRTKSIDTLKSTYDFI